MNKVKRQSIMKFSAKPSNLSRTLTAKLKIFKRKRIKLEVYPWNSTKRIKGMRNQRRILRRLSANSIKLIIYLGI
jgi:hypothetical protein